jgi:hypothetical protein
MTTTPRGYIPTADRGWLINWVGSSGALHEERFTDDGSAWSRVSTLVEDSHVRSVTINVTLEVTLKRVIMHYHSGRFRWMPDSGTEFEMDDVGE